MSNSTTLLDTIATNQSNKEAVANALFDAASPGMLWGRHASACSGLTWGYYGGYFGTNAIANGTLTLTASATNNVYADGTTGAVSVTTGAFPTGAVRLYQIVTGTTTVTSYTDMRSGGGGGGGSGGSSTLSGLNDVSVSEGAGIDGYYLQWSNSLTKWVAVKFPSQPYDVTMFSPGLMTASQVLARIVIPRAVTFPSGLTGSYANASAAATASTVLSIQQNGTQVGTITFAAGGNTGTFSFASAITSSAGDVWQIVGPSGPDATLGNVSITLVGSR